MSVLRNNSFVGTFPTIYPDTWFVTICFVFCVYIIQCTHTASFTMPTQTTPIVSLRAKRPFVIVTVFTNALVDQPSLHLVNTIVCNLCFKN